MSPNVTRPLSTITYSKQNIDTDNRAVRSSRSLITQNKKAHPSGWSSLIAVNASDIQRKKPQQPRLKR